METLVDLMGGVDTFESRLDLMVRVPRRRRTLANWGVCAKYVRSKPRTEWSWNHDNHQHRVHTPL